MILKKNEALAPYLMAAYNPYQRYFITYCADGEGKEQFDAETWEILNDLRTRKLSGHLAQDIVNAHTARLTPQSAELFRRILNKDLRMGASAKTINKALPNIIPTHDIMLAKLFDSSRVKFPCFVSPKIDGVRAVFKFGEFYSRRGHKFLGLGKLKKQLEGFKEPLDGELIIPGKTFQESSGRIRSDCITPDAMFNVFELPTMRDPFYERVMMMEDMTGMFENVAIVPHFKARNIDDIYTFYKQARSIGYEGAVVKPFNYQYVGTRSWHWMKLKNKMKDLELEVIDVYEGTGKYQGKLGGAIVRYHGSKGTKYPKVGSGFSDKQREDFWSGSLFKGDSILIGKYIQMEAMEETDDGSLRHPVFKEIKE